MYTPNKPPADVRVLPEYLEQEMLRISDAIHDAQVRIINFEVIDIIPNKLQEGMVINFAAGIVGAQAGLYEYIGGAWIKL